MTQVKEKLNPYRSCLKLINQLPQRSSDVLKRRFGIDAKEGETLEAIGKSYHITRERVRQIEEDAIKKMRASSQFSSLKTFFQKLSSFVKSNGDLMEEKRLLEEFLSLCQGAKGLNQQRATYFMLTIGGSFIRHSETKKYRPFWLVPPNALKTAIFALDHIKKYLKQKGVPQKFDSITSACKKLKITQKALVSYLSISKEIMKNPYGEWGLSAWSLISPRGMRDKAYLVMKKESKPFHFTEVSKLIEKYIPGRKAHIQTVHNELIKDKRFVLIGRGIYALQEWGYIPGTVKDVLIKILKDVKKPLSKEDIIKRALRMRMVKPNTLILNLQTNKVFVRTADGRYALKR